MVGEWTPRLLPGAVGAATHGLIRTGHALRALGAADTPPRRLEVANGLAFWASSYQELPGPPLLIGHEGVADALADLPYLPEDAPRAALIGDRIAVLDDIADEFEQAVASLGWTGGAVELLDQLATGRGAGLPAQRRRRWCHRPSARGDVTAGRRAAAPVAGAGRS